MSDVLIRDVPGDDLELIRSTAAEQGLSLQSYLRTTLQAQATYLRRQHALLRTGQRLSGRRAVPDDERSAVLDAVAADHTSRSADLLDRDG